MKNIALSLLVVLVLAAVLLVPLSMFDVTKEAAKPIVPLIDSLPILIVGQYMVRQKFVSSLPSGPKMGLYCLTVFLIGVAKYGLPLVFGYWRGRVIQSSRYLVYLLRALPQESRDTLVNLASDEAKRLASNSAPKPSVSSA